MVVPARFRPCPCRPSGAGHLFPAIAIRVEVWSPSTGSYDVDTKIPEYQQRGDLEIWRIHPYERTLTAWRRQADGVYVETKHDRGEITLHALPEVTLLLDDLFPG